MRLGIVGTGLLGASLIDPAIAADAADESVAYGTDAELLPTSAHVVRPSSLPAGRGISLPAI